MQLPNVLSTEEGVSLYLAKLTHKRAKADSEEGHGLFDWTLDLTLSLDDEVVDSVPAYLFGAKEALQRANEGKGTSKPNYKPLDDERKILLTIWGLDGSDRNIITKAHAEVRYIEVVAIEKSPRYRCKILLPGIGSVMSGDLLEADHRTISIDTLPLQGELELEVAAK